MKAQDHQCDLFAAQNNHGGAVNTWDDALQLGAGEARCMQRACEMMVGVATKDRVRLSDLARQNRD